MNIKHHNKIKKSKTKVDKLYIVCTFADNINKNDILNGIKNLINNFENIGSQKIKDNLRGVLIGFEETSKNIENLYTEFSRVNSSARSDIQRQNSREESKREESKTVGLNSSQLRRKSIRSGILSRDSYIPLL